MENRKEKITDGKELMEIVTGAAWWELNRDEVEPGDAEVYIDKLYGKIIFSLKNWSRYFDEDRNNSEIGLTMDIEDIKKFGYSLVASITYRKAADPKAEQQFNAALRIVKD